MQRRFGSDSPRAGVRERHREMGSDVGSSSGNGISETRRGEGTREYSAWKRGFRNAWRGGRATSTRWGAEASLSFLSKGNLDPRRSGWKGILFPFFPIKASRCFEGWINVRNDTYDVHTYVVGRTCDAHVDATSLIQHEATDGRMEGWMQNQRIHDTEGSVEWKDARCAGNAMHVGIERSRRTQPARRRGDVLPPTVHDSLPHHVRGIRSERASLRRLRYSSCPSSHRNARLMCTCTCNPATLELSSRPFVDGVGTCQS